MSTSNKNDSELALVPENVLKKRHDLDELKRKREAHEEAHGGKPRHAGGKKGGGNKKSVYVVKPETILAHKRTRRNQETRFNRIKKKGMQKRAVNHQTQGVKLVQEDYAETATELVYQSNSVGAPMVFVVRIRDSVATPKQVLSNLDRLRLKNLHDGVFVKYTESARKVLHRVEPWVAYGPPSAFTVKDLLERRGFAKIDGQRVPLSDNTVIEDALGEHGILCVEDIAHELVSAGENFETASSFLWPFQLADSKTSFQRRTLKLKDGKEYGDRGEAINDYIKQVL